MKRAAVIIPYFQRTHGLLDRAMRSINGQDFAGEITVIIVDDGSPSPLIAEAIQCRPGVSVTTRRQQNAGPAAARNTALGMVPDGIQMAAFLDSDDEWPDDHLSRAAAAFDGGADFYFCDFQRAGQPLSAFEKMEFSGGGHEALQDDPRIRLFRGDFFDLVLRLFHVGTSTVVFDFARFGQLRFEESFRRSHEDTLFWLALAAGARKIAFSDVLVRYGSDGVGIYHHATWGSREYLEMMHDEIAYARHVRAQYPLSASQDAFLRDHIAVHRRNTASAALHRLGRSFELGQFWRQLALDPMLLLHLPQCVVAGLTRRAKEDPI